MSDSSVKQGKLSYIESFFFPKKDELDERYISLLSERYGLRLVRKESMATGCRTFLHIEDIEKLGQIIDDVEELKRFAYGEIGRAQIVHKQIALWKYFQLSSSATKNQVSGRIKDPDKLRLEIGFIENDAGFEEQLSQAANAVTIDIQIYGNKIDVSDLRSSNIVKVEEFARIISSYDKVEYIRLDESVVTIEVPELGGRHDSHDAKVLTISPNAPVVAVIDSGIQRNSLTNSFLMDEGLDYTSGVSPTSGNPFEDLNGHGTAVACEIAYGHTLREHLIEQVQEALLPVAKIFPVRVFGKNVQQTTVDYTEIFELEGLFAKAIKRHNIRLINLSLTHENPLQLETDLQSVTGGILDAFIRHLGVIIVICTGNIPLASLRLLIQKYPTLSFYSRENGSPWDMADHEININPPSDCLGGVTVGGSHKQRKRDVVASFSKSLHVKNHNGLIKPDLVALNSGDAAIDLEATPLEIDATRHRVISATQYDNLLELSIGTSLATPRVTRALAIGISKYKELNNLSLRGLLLHKASEKPAKPMKYGENHAGEVQTGKIAMHKAFCGIGCMSTTDEDEFLSDSDDEITFILEGMINENEIETFEIPIANMLGDGSGKMKNKLAFKLSVCYSPIAKETDGVAPIAFKQANILHISAVAHLNSFNPIKTKTIRNKEYKSQCVSKDEKILVPWTSDYVQNYYPCYANEQAYHLKDGLLKKLNGDETCRISVRCSSRAKKAGSLGPQPFSIIFSVKDMGATGEIRNFLNIRI